VLDVEVCSTRPNAESSSSIKSRVVAVGIEENNEAWLFGATKDVGLIESDDVPLLMVDSGPPSPKAERSPSRTPGGIGVGIGVDDVIPLLDERTSDVDVCPTPSSESSGLKSMIGSLEEAEIAPELDVEEGLAPRSDNSGPISTIGSTDDVGIAPEVNVGDISAPLRMDHSGPRSTRGLLINPKDVVGELSIIVDVSIEREVFVEDT
jgi:hypothetical protein